MEYIIFFIIILILLFLHKNDERKVEKKSKISQLNLYWKDAFEKYIETYNYERVGNSSHKADDTKYIIFWEDSDGKKLCETFTHDVGSANYFRCKDRVSEMLNVGEIKSFKILTDIHNIKYMKDYINS